MDHESAGRKPPGMPEVVHQLFETQRADFEAFAAKIGGKIERPIGLDTTTGTWVWPLCRPIEGKRFRFLVVTNDNLAAFGLFAVALYVHRQELRGPMADDAYQPTGHNRQVNTGKLLSSRMLEGNWVISLREALEQLEQDARDFAAQIPVAPRPPASA